MRFAVSVGLLGLLGSLMGCSASGDEGVSADSAFETANSFGPNAGSHEAPDSCAAVLAAIKPAVDAALPQAHTKDVGVGVITNGCKFQGYASGPDAVPADALYRVGSISKTYTAALIEDLVAHRQLGLDDTIARFDLKLPNQDRITVRQLLNHSSGLFNYTDDPTFGQHLDWTPRERLAAAAGHDVYFEPGAGWHYSNTNYIALGFIAEQVGGASAPELIRTRILEPNGLAHTFFAGEESLGGTLAPNFMQNGTAIPGEVGLIGAWTDGAMAATLEDTTRWMRTYGARSELYDNGLAIPGTPLTYSFALFNLPPQATGDVAGHGHGGDIPGFHSWSVHMPERGWTITAIVNQDGGDANAFLIALMQGLKACTTAGKC